jgi:taurine dioxygenase
MAAQPTIKDPLTGLTLPTGAALTHLSSTLGTEAEHVEFGRHFGATYYYPNMERSYIDQLMEHYPPKVHPIVQTHPVTGRKILYVSLGFTSRIVGIPREESEPLLRLLAEQARIPEYQVRFSWQENAIAHWDNRTVQHYACFDYLGQPRELHRVTLLGQERWPRAS